MALQPEARQRLAVNLQAAGHPEGGQNPPLSPVVVGLNSVIRDIRSHHPGLRAGQMRPAERLEVDDLHDYLDQLTLDLLLQRRDGTLPEEVYVLIQGGPGEILHPFSRNGADVYIPSTEGRSKFIPSRTTLKRLRRIGLINDSLQAYELLAPAWVAHESPREFLRRTYEELQGVRHNQTRAISSRTPKELEELRQTEQFLLSRLRILTSSSQPQRVRSPKKPLR